MRAIHWFRRDLRLSDNAALSAALEANDEVLAVFVLDPRLTQAKNQSPARLAFLYAALANLDATLQAHGANLIIRQGEPLVELTKLLTESKAQGLYFNRDYTPYARKRDDEVVKELKAVSYTVELVKDLVLFEQTELLTGADAPYTVYTPYKRRWLERIQADPPLASTPDFSRLRVEDAAKIKSLPLPPAPVGFENAWWQPASETEAQHRLKNWLGRLQDSPQPPGIGTYAKNRNLPGLDATSHLSPFLRFGLLSPRQCYRGASNARERAPGGTAMEGCETWLGEIIWRDFYYQILWNFPHVAVEPFQKKFARLEWSIDKAHFAAWCDGRTGYPIVDAGMRQLKTQHWMHNRLRMIVASFLTKDLLINWQSGERYFWQMLVDGDQAANNGGWQWAASTGTDAQPYFRIFNPVSQGQKFDPDGTYIKKYVPELANVPPKYLHAPWTMPLALQQHVGCIIGQDYPAPIIDHAAQRTKALALYKV